MVHKIARWLAACPHVEGLTVGSLQPGAGTGIFPKGITRVSRDILGGSRVTTSVLLRHRDYRDSGWVQQLSDWVIANPPEDMTVTPRGGRLCSPTKDGWGTWELEIVIESL